MLWYPRGLNVTRVTITSNHWSRVKWMASKLKTPELICTNCKGLFFYITRIYVSLFYSAQSVKKWKSDLVMPDTSLHSKNVSDIPAADSLMQPIIKLLIYGYFQTAIVQKKLHFFSAETYSNAKIMALSMSAYRPYILKEREKTGEVTRHSFKLNHWNLRKWKVSSTCDLHLSLHIFICACCSTRSC